VLSIDPDTKQVGWITKPTGGGGGTTLPSGTIIGNTLRWSGSAWVENAEFRTYYDRVRLPQPAGNPASGVSIGHMWYNTVTDNLRFSHNASTIRSVASIEDDIKGTEDFTTVKNASAVLQAGEVITKWNASGGVIDITLDTAELREGVIYNVIAHNNETNGIRFVVNTTNCANCTIEASGQISGSQQTAVIVGAAKTGFRAPNQVYTIRRRNNAFLLMAGNEQASENATNGVLTSSAAVTATGATAAAIPGFSLPVTGGEAYMVTVMWKGVASAATADPTFTLTGSNGTRYWSGTLQTAATGTVIMSEFSSNTSLVFPSASAGTRDGTFTLYLYPSADTTINFNIQSNGADTFTVNANARLMWHKL
jgi:hypothetical protein